MVDRVAVIRRPTRKQNNKTEWRRDFLLDSIKFRENKFQFGLGEWMTNLLFTDYVII